jgi:hypothetical protein
LADGLAMRNDATVTRVGFALKNVFREDCARAAPTMSPEPAVAARAAPARISREGDYEGTSKTRATNMLAFITETRSIDRARTPP